MKRSILALIAATLATSATAVAPPREASIPFLNHGTIDDWRPDGDKALYLRAAGSKWYHAELMGSCPDLDFSEAIGVELGGTNTLDKFSTLIVRGRRCALQSLVESAPPPKKDKARK